MLVLYFKNPYNIVHPLYDQFQSVAQLVLLESGNIFLNQEDTFHTNGSSDFSSDCDTYLSSSEEESETHYLREDLITWANKHQIRQCALDDLLKVLRSQGHDTLPATARTLLKTVRVVDIQNKSGMQYIHLSLSKEIEKVLKRYPCEVTSRIHSLEISLNVDGLSTLQKFIIVNVACVVLHSS